MDSAALTSEADGRCAGGGPVDLLAVVVVHDNAGLLSRCLQALDQAGQQVNARVIVIDSGSRDDPGAVCAGLPLIRVSNRGFGAAFNVALTRDEAREARYILQLNPDVALPVGGFDALVTHADQLPRCGVLAPRQIDQHGELIFSIGVEPSAARLWRALGGSVADWVSDQQRYRVEGQLATQLRDLVLPQVDRVVTFGDRRCACVENHRPVLEQQRPVTQ